MENKKVIGWLLRSSVDPKKYSTSFKAGALAIMPIAVAFFGFDSGDYGALVSAVALAIEYVLGTISAVALAYGLIRKIYYKRWAA